jgi:hypothetical protein
MPAMRKQGIILLFLMLMAAGVHAQEKKYVYKDSTVDQVIEAPPAEEEIKEEVVAAPKEEDDSPLADYEKRPDTSLRFRYLYVSPDTVQYWKDMKAFAYATYLDSLLKNRQFKIKQQELKKQKEQERSSEKQSSESSSLEPVDLSPGFFSSPALTVIFWILAIGFILFILYSLFLKDGVFRRSSKAIATAAGDEEVQEVKPGTEMDSLITQAVRDKNYRLAVRYQYLKNLHKLAEKGFVQYAADKTNYQYVNEITNTGLRNEFAGVTLNYEYVWYGEFQIDEPLYRKLETGFNTLFNKI